MKRKLEGKSYFLGSFKAMLVFDERNARLNFMARCFALLYDVLISFSSLFPFVALYKRDVRRKCKMEETELVKKLG